MRVGSSNHDFNISTFPLPDVQANQKDNRNNIITNTRNNYAKAKAELDDLLVSLLPKQRHSQKKEVSKDNVIEKKIIELTDKGQTIPVIIDDIDNGEQKGIASLEAGKEKILRKEEEREQESKHTAIANYVIALGQQRNFISHKELTTKEGGRIDVVLKRDNLSIAVEISVTNSIDYELHNLQKCHNENMSHIYLISESKVHLRNIKKRAKEIFEKDEFKKFGFGTPAEFLTFLGKFEVKPKKEIKRVRGYRVKSNFKDIGNTDAQSRNQKIQDIILRKGKNKKRLGKTKQQTPWMCRKQNRCLDL